MRSEAQDGAPFFGDGKLRRESPIDRLFHKEVAPVVIRSHDEELTALPPPLTGIREGRFLWELMSAPLVKEEDIAQRQGVIEWLKEDPERIETRDAKTTSYGIPDGMAALFQPVAVGRYRDHQEPLLHAFKSGQRHDLGDQVYAAIEEIKRGALSLRSFAETLQTADNVDLVQVGEELMRKAERAEQLTREKILGKKFSEQTAITLTAGIGSDLIAFGALVEFAHIVSDKEHWAKVEFPETGPYGYAGGWYIGKPKERQVLNDSPADKPVTVYVSPNTSGKSQSGLKLNFTIQRIGQSMGYTPTDGRETPTRLRVHDSLVYKDRPTSADSHNDLSSYGVDVIDWKDVWSFCGPRLLQCIDEPFSTTSFPESRRLTRGVVASLFASREARIFIASNDDALPEYLKDVVECGIYHFPFEEIDDEYRPTYSLTEGIGPAMGIPVAARIGHPAEIIDNARRLQAGLAPIETAVAVADTPPIMTYTEDERRLLNKQPESIRRLLGDPNKPRLLHILSHDRDFRIDQHHTLPTGEPYNRQVLGGWCYNSSEYRARLVRAIIFNGNRPEMDDLLERQHMFAQISQRDEFDTVKKLSEEIAFMLKFGPMVSDAASGLLRFNQIIGPKDREVSYHLRSRPDEVAALTDFFNLNRKIMGADFPCPAQCETIDALAAFVDRKRQEFSALTIDEFNDRVAQARQATVPDEVATIFLQLATDEPERAEKGPVVTIERMRQYFNWLHEANHHQFVTVFDQHGDSPGNKLYGYVVHQPNLVRSEAEKQKEIRRMPLSAGEIEIVEGVAGEGKIDSIYGLLRIDEVEDYLREERFRVFTIISKHAAPVSIFDVNIKEVRDELQRLIDRKKEAYRKDRSLDEFGYWPEALLTALLIEMHISERPSTSELVALLESYDSVPLHQSARFISDWAQHLNEANDDDMGRALTNPQTILAQAAAVYEQGIATIYREFANLCGDRQRLLAKYGIEDDKLIGDIRTVLSRNWRDVSNQQADRIIKAFEKLVADDSGDLSQAIDQFRQQASSPGRTLQALFNEFYRSHIFNSEIHDILSEFDAKYRAFCERVVDFIETNGIDLSYVERTDFQTYHVSHESQLPDIRKTGNLDRIREILEARFRNELQQAIQFNEQGGRQLEAETDALQALFLFGRMIREQAMTPVKFNDLGILDIRGMYYLYGAYEDRVRHDLAIEPDTRGVMYGSPNSSGKTYSAKELAVAVATGLTTGFLPAAAARIPYIDGIFFIDRLPPETKRGESSHEADSKGWRQILYRIEEMGRVLVIADEPRSAASPADQTALNTATARYLLRRGHYVLYATHDHETIDRLVADGLAKVYHFDYRIDEAGVAQFTFKLKEGHRPSEAIAVARKLGLPEEILRHSEQIP